MGRVADLVMDTLAAEVENRAGWDELPALYFMYLHEGKCHVSQLDVPASYWEAEPPARVLQAPADGLGEFSGLMQALAPGELHGAAFRCEMWEVRTAEDGEERARAEAAADQRRLYAHPDRVEVRSMWAVDRAGVTYDVTMDRTTGDVRRQVVYPKPGVPGFTGIIPNALDRLVMSLLGVELAARPTR